MPTVVECPSCNRKLRVPDDLLGQSVKCPGCGVTFQASDSGAVPQPPPAPAPPTYPQEQAPDLPPGEDQERIRAQRTAPSRREPEEDEDRDEDRPRRRNFAPHRGGLILALGIIRIVGGVMGMPAWCCGLCSSPLFFFSIGGLVSGILAWMMGQADLPRIAKGQIDPSGESQTRGGKTCGIVGTCVSGFALLCGIVLLILNVALGVAMQLPK